MGGKDQDRQTLKGQTCSSDHATLPIHCTKGTGNHISHFSSKAAICLGNYEGNAEETYPAINI